CSLGMRQKARVWRAIQGEPELLLLDEPLNSLDRESALAFSSWLSRYAKEKNALALVAQHGTDFPGAEVLRLEGGRLR
ncbi:MAG TPA: hypothetical protein VIH99_12015, partial [Bdellovibrionota bacterium]